MSPTETARPLTVRTLRRAALELSATDPQLGASVERFGPPRRTDAHHCHDAAVERDNSIVAVTRGGPLPDAAPHLPVGLAMMPDGSLLIGDDKGCRIWRVFYPMK